MIDPDVMLWKLKADAEMARAEAAEKRVRELEDALAAALDSWRSAPPESQGDYEDIELLTAVLEGKPWAKGLKLSLDKK